MTVLVGYPYHCQCARSKRTAAEGNDRGGITRVDDDTFLSALHKLFVPVHVENEIKWKSRRETLRDGSRSCNMQHFQM